MKKHLYYLHCKKKKSINISTLQIKESMLEATQGISNKEITTHDYYRIIIYVSHMTWIVSHNLKLGSFHWGKNVIVVSNIFLVSSFLIPSCLLVRIYMKTQFSEQRKTTHISFHTFHFKAFHPETFPSLVSGPDWQKTQMRLLTPRWYHSFFSRSCTYPISIADMPSIYCSHWFLLQFSAFSIGISNEALRKWGAIRKGW